LGFDALFYFPSEALIPVNDQYKEKQERDEYFPEKRVVESMFIAYGYPLAIYFVSFIFRY
jgi:hypothetical protein